MSKLTWVAMVVAMLVAFALLLNATGSSRDINHAHTAILAAKYGQADNSALGLVLAVAAVLIGLLVGVIAYLVLRVRMAAPAQKWQPGPNAKWARKSAPAPQFDPSKALVEMYIAEQLRARQQTATPAQHIEIQEVEEEISW